MYIFTSLLLVALTLKTSVNSVNVGTVLFRAADNFRTCWSDEDIATLSSRMFFEDILPSETTFDITNDNFILVLIDYFKMVVRHVRNSAEGKTKQILLTALSDCLGGYLHHIVLPLARYAYYCGNINYSSMEKLQEMQREIKTFLRTEGKSWQPPITDFTYYQTEIKPIICIKIRKPCEKLIFYEGEEAEEHKRSIYIPMPYMDTDVNPHAITVPFKNYILRNIQGQNAAFILVKFFVTVSKCLEEKRASYETTYKFYRDLEDFLDQKVMPLLDDHKFYSAFGGVLRLKKTIKQLLGSMSDLDVNRRSGTGKAVMESSSSTNDTSARIITTIIPDAEMSKHSATCAGNSEIPKKLVKREDNVEFDDFASFHRYAEDYVDMNIPYDVMEVSERDVEPRYVGETAKYKLAFLVMCAIVGFLFLICCCMGCMYCRAKRRECLNQVQDCQPCGTEDPRKYQLANRNPCEDWTDNKPPCPASGYVCPPPPEPCADKRRKKSIKDRFRNLLVSQSAHAYPMKNNTPCQNYCRQPCGSKVEPRYSKSNNNPPCRAPCPGRSPCGLIDHIYMDSCTTDSSPRTTSPSCNASKRSWRFNRKKSECN